MPARSFSRVLDLDSLRRLLRADTMHILENVGQPKAVRPPPIVIDPANPPLMPKGSVFERQGVPIGLNMQRTPHPRDPLTYVDPIQEIDQEAFTGVVRPSPPPLDEEAARLLAEKIEDLPTPRQPMVPSHLIDKTPASQHRIVYGSGDGPDIEELYAQDPFFSTGDWAESDMRHRDEMEPRLTALLKLDPEAFNAQAKKRGTPTWEQLHQRITNSYGPRGDALFAPLLPPVKPTQPSTMDKLIERAKKYARKVGFDYPAGEYVDSEIPGGRRKEFIPADSAKEAITDLEIENDPGFQPPTLHDITRHVSDATGEGMTQGHMQTNVRMPQDVADHTWWISHQTGIDPKELQTVWDRIHGNYFMDEPAAQAKIHDWLDSIQEVYDQAERGKQDPIAFARAKYDRTRNAIDGVDLPPDDHQGAHDPVRAAQSHYAKTRGLLPGVPGEGFFENVAAEDTGFNRAQLEEFGDTGFEQGSGFTGDEFEAAQREEHHQGRKRVTDVQDKWLVGHEPLEAVRHRGGQVSPNQVENIRAGIGDLMIVPRGAITETGGIRLGAKQPFDASVLDIRPLHAGMGRGFLEEVSRRAKLPLRTLRTLVNGGLEYDLVHVSTDPKNAVIPLPAEARRRHPEELGFWGSDKGVAQREKLFRYPRILELLLSKAGARVVSNNQGDIGDDILGVIWDKKQPWAVMPPRQPGKAFYAEKLQQVDGVLHYKGKPFQPNSLEAKEFAREFAVKNPDHVKGDFPSGPALMAGKQARMDALRHDEAAATRASEAEYLRTGEANPQVGARPTVVGAVDFASGDIRDPNLYVMSQANRSGPFISVNAPIEDSMGKLVPHGERQADMVNATGFASGTHLEERSPGGVPLSSDPKTLDRELRLAERAGPRVPFVKGLPLSLEPLRRNFSLRTKANPDGIKFWLPKTPKVYGKHTWKGPAGPTSLLRKFGILRNAKDAKNAELTVFFTERTPANPNGEFAAIEKKEDRDLPRTLVNPTADELRGVLGHSNVRNVVIRVQEPNQKGPSQNLWNRVHAVIEDVQRPGEHELLGRLGPEATTRGEMMASARPATGETAPAEGKAWPSPGLSTRQAAESERLTTLAMRLKGDPARRDAVLRRWGQMMHVPETDPRVLERLMFNEAGQTHPLVDARSPGLEKQSRTLVANLVRAESPELRASLAKRWAKINRVDPSTPQMELEQLMMDEGVQSRTLPRTNAEKPSPQEKVVTPETPMRGPFEATAARIEEAKAQPRRKTNWLEDAFTEENMKALGIGAATLGLLGIGESITGNNKAEAAPRSYGAAKKIREVLTQFEHPSTYKPSLTKELLTATNNYLEPIYETAKQRGLDYKGLREGRGGLEGLQVLSGSLGRRAEQAYQEARLAGMAIHKQGLSDDLDLLIAMEQDLRAWDMAPRKRDGLYTKALVAEAQGQDELALKLRDKAQALDNNIANRDVVAGKRTKEDIVAEMQDFYDRHGPDVYGKLKAVAQLNYQAVEKAVKRLHEHGLISDESFKELEDRGWDHIPSWLTEFELNPETNQVTWHGGVPFKTVTTDIKGTTEQLIDEAMGHRQETKSPTANAARFVTLAEAEIVRNEMSERVTQAFGAEQVNRELFKKSPIYGQETHTHMRNGVPVTHLLPTQVVDSLMFADQDFVNRYLSHIPEAAAKALSTTRAITEAGSTAASVGWATKQILTHDPAAAVFQLPSKGNIAQQRTLSRIPSYYKKLADNTVRNLYSDLWSGRSSPARQEAAERGILYGSVAGDYQDMSTVEGRDRQGGFRKALEEGKLLKAAGIGVQKGLASVARVTARPFDDAQKIASMQLMEEERLKDIAKGRTPFSREEINYHARTSGGSPDLGQKGSNDALVRQIPFARTTLLANETALRRAKNNPARFLKHFVTLVAIEGAKEAFNEKTAEEIGLPLDELKGRYSEYDLDNTFLVMLPPSYAKHLTGDGSTYERGSNGITRPYAWKWAYPPIISQILSPARGAVKALKSGNPWDVPATMADSILPGSVPFETKNLPAFGKSVAMRGLAALPGYARIPLEEGFNIQGFTGAPIVGSRIEGLTAPDEVSGGTEPFYKELGRVTGGSPARLQHIGKAALPGAFQWPIGLINALQPEELARNGKRIPKVSQSPLESGGAIPGPVGDLIRMMTPQRYERDLGNYQDDFYSLREQTKSAATAMKDWDAGMSTREPSALTKAMAAANPGVVRMVIDMAEIANQIQATRMSTELTGDQKLARIVDLTNAKRARLKAFLQMGPIPALVEGRVPVRPATSPPIGVP